MIKVAMVVDLSDWNKMTATIRDEHPKAIARSLNKTATTARAQSAREIVSAGYKMKISAIKKAITIRRATASDLSAIVKASGKPIPLINYGARQNKQGTTVDVLNGRKLLKGAFIATMKSGHKGVFVRVGSAAERTVIRAGRFKVAKGKTVTSRKHGLPIRELFGPSVPQGFQNEIVQKALVLAIEQRFGVVLDQELRYIKLS